MVKKINKEKLATWSHSYIKSLPDSAFLYVKKVGDKKIRKLPYKDKSGSIDIAHLRNAIVRLSQSKTDISESVKSKLLAKAKKLLKNINEKKSQSMEENSKMSKKKEQLNEVAIQSVDELDEEVEQLSLEILQTREELAVITEVRDELVKLYSDYKELEKLNAKVTSENDKFKKEIEKLSSDLYDYKLAEKKVEEEKRLQRLEHLSAKFNALGQTKTVEQLSEKSSETLDEFEKIVDAALDKLDNVTEMPSVTINSQEERASSKKTSDVEKVKDDVAKENPKEQLSNEKFFANICNTLTSEQAGLKNKRTKLL